MSMPVRVRPAIMTDTEAVAAIYNEGIRGRMATFETRERSADDIAGWFEDGYPFLVAVRADRDDEVIGWVHASSYRQRECYAGIVEFSVYVASSSRGERVGDALMKAFIDKCSERGIWKILSRVFPENAASRALCARNGFREAGVYEKHACLDGAWRDVIIVERLLSVNQH
jgi:L-amino acid N-acyltransferase YncA